MCMNVTTKDFLQLLFGKCTEGCITITTLPGSRNEHIPVRELDRAAEQIVKYGMSANTYYGLALRCAGLPETVRGSVDEIKTVVCNATSSALNQIGIFQRAQRTFNAHSAASQSFA